MSKRAPLTRRFLIAFLMMIYGVSLVRVFAADPALPVTFIDTTYSLPSGQTWTVHQGDNLQNAIDNAALGDVIVLEAGATFTGNYKLPNKTSGSGWIYIISSQLGQLPEGVRVKPEDSIHMPKIVSPNSMPAITTMFSAHHYRFAGVEFSVDAGNYNLILMGYGLTNYSDPLWSDHAATTVEQLPTHITFDRCYVHSTSLQNWARTGILAGGNYVAVIDSYISNFKDGSDAQAICSWFGEGPFKIVNNYLEATGENIMFGGEKIPIPNNVPSDIEVRGNYFHKPFCWMIGDPNFVMNWTVKNLFELKCAQRVLLSGNVFENNWALEGQNSSGQRATAIVLTVRNQYGDSPWAVVQDVTFTNNIIRHVGRGFNILGTDDNYSSQQTKRILIQNNLLEDLNCIYYYNSGSSGFNFCTPKDKAPSLDVTIRNNLLLHAGAPGSTMYFGDYSKVAENFKFENNIVTHADYGVIGCAVGEGSVALNAFTTIYNFQKNLIINQPGERIYDYLKTHIAGLYPTDNFYAFNMRDVGFSNFSNKDYVLDPSSLYKNAGTDGKDLGPDWGALNSATANSVHGGGGLSSNQAPQVNAGQNQSIVFPADTQLSGQVSDDGIPGGRVSFFWRKVSGTGNVTFSNTSILNPTVQFSSLGVYVLRLVAYDGDLISCDDVQISVTNPNGTVPSGYDVNVISPQTGTNAQIGFSCNGQTHVMIKIYSRGGLVRELVNQDYATGIYTVLWDGKNGDGSKVASGIYTATLDIGGKKTKKKIAVVR